MKKRLFTDSGISPTETLMRKQMGNAMEYYHNILAISGKYRKQWSYGSGSGWLLKVGDMRKNLFYLMPFDTGIDISLAIRGTERTALLNDRKLEDLFLQLSDAKQYPEGYALRFEIESSEECEITKSLIDKLINIRASEAAFIDKRMQENKKLRANALRVSQLKSGTLHKL